LWSCHPQGGAFLKYPGLPYAALSGQETQKAPHRASSQQTDGVLSRLAGTRLPDEPFFFGGKAWIEKMRFLVKVTVKNSDKERSEGLFTH
jgi:hypothetical protein